MTTTQPRYRARFGEPYWLPRGRAASTLRLYIEDEATGSPVTPTSATFTLRDTTETAVVDAQSALTLGNPSTYLVTSTHVPAATTLSELWYVEWSATISGVAYTFGNSAYVVRREPACPIGVSDLAELHPTMPNFATAERTHTAVVSDALRSAWQHVIRQIIKAGKNPARILSAYSTHDLVEAQALHRLYAGAFGVVGAEQYAQARDYYAKAYQAAWSTFSADYDKDGDGKPGEGEQDVAGQPVIMTTIAGNWRRSPRRGW